jgi:hypothetical protein
MFEMHADRLAPGDDPFEGSEHQVVDGAPYLGLIRVHRIIWGCDLYPMTCILCPVSRDLYPVTCDQTF